MATLRRLCVAVAFVGGVATSLGAQQPQPARPTGVPRPPNPGPLFFSEHWRNPKTYAEGTLPLTSVTQEVVTTPDMELTVDHPNRPSTSINTERHCAGVRGGRTGRGQPVFGSTGSRGPRLGRVVWGGDRDAGHRRNFVDLSNRGRVIWGTYVSGFHVARLVVKLADGTFLVGDPGTGTPDVHIENEVVLSSLRWLKLQGARDGHPRKLGGEARLVQGGRDRLDSAHAGFGPRRRRLCRRLEIRGLGQAGSPNNRAPTLSRPARFCLHGGARPMMPRDA